VPGVIYAQLSLMGLPSVCIGCLDYAWMKSRKRAFPSRSDHPILVQKRLVDSDVMPTQGPQRIYTNVAYYGALVVNCHATHAPAVGRQSGRAGLLIRAGTRNRPILHQPFTRSTCRRILSNSRPSPLNLRYIFIRLPQVQDTQISAHLFLEGGYSDGSGRQ
jgi:hypothetical protein